MKHDPTMRFHPSPPLNGHSIPVGLPDARLPISEYGDKLRTALRPGQVLCIESGPHLILEILGEGGTAIAVLTTPLQLAWFKGRGVKLEDFPSPGLYSFLEGDTGALYHWRQFRSLRVLKIALAHPNDPMYELIWEVMVRELDCSGAMKRPAMPIVFGAGIKPLLHLVLEYVEGQTLAQILAARYKAGKFIPFRWVYLQNIMGRLSRALVPLHERHIVHCDLKPENVIVHEERLGIGEMDIRILDLGLARYVPPESLVELVRRGLVQGPFEKTVAARGCTPAWAAPEQLDGRNVSEATDIYSLGVILYALMTGDLPFSKGPAAELCTPGGIIKYHAAMQGPFAPPAHREFPPQAPSTRVLTDLLTTVLKFKPEERMCSAGAFADTINEISRLREQERRSGVHRPTIRFRILKEERVQRAEHNRRAMRVWGFRILLIALLTALTLFAAPHIHRQLQPVWQWLGKVASVEPHGQTRLPSAP